MAFLLAVEKGIVTVTSTGKIWHSALTLLLCHVLHLLDQWCNKLTMGCVWIHMAPVSRACIQYFVMSLFQLDFKPVSSSSSSRFQDQQQNVPPHMPLFEESRLGIVEYTAALPTASDLADPNPTEYALHILCIHQRTVLTLANTRWRMGTRESGAIPFQNIQTSKRAL